MAIYRVSKGSMKGGATVRCQRGGPSRGVRPRWQGAQKGLREVQEATKSLCSEFRAEEVVHAAVPKELGPEGRSEGAGGEDVVEGVEVGVWGGVSP